MRVSSAAMRGTVRSTSSARSVTSPRLPIGVATMNRLAPTAAGFESPPASRGAGRVTPLRTRRARASPRVQVVDAGGPWAELGDGWNLALELRGRDEPLDALHQVALEAHRDELVGGAAT